MYEITNINFTFSAIWKTVLSVVASFGGAAGIIVLIIKFSGNRIAEKLQARYQLSMQKEIEQFKADIDKRLEEHKSVLSNKQHISVKRFDAEFEIYQKLTKTIFDAVRDCNILIPRGYTLVPQKREERLELDKKHFESAWKSVKEAQDYFYSIIPFIPEEFFITYKEILRLCSMQINAYEERFNINDLRSQEEKETFTLEDYKRSTEIYEKFEKLNCKIRDYLNNLDVID